MTINGHIAQIITADVEPDADRLERNREGRSLEARYHDRLFVVADPGMDLRQVDGKHKNGRGELVVCLQRQRVDERFVCGALELEGLEVGGLVRLDLSEDPDPLERVLMLVRPKK